MNHTRQISLRLPHYHVNIVESFQQEKGLKTFTEAVKEIVLEHHKTKLNDTEIERFILKLESLLKGTTPAGYKGPGSEFEIIDELSEMGKNIRLILKVLYIVGTADSNTLTAIEDLFGEEAD